MENTLKIYWPFKPYVITQVWGNPNSAYSKQFNDSTFTLHNGIDANIGARNWDGSTVSEYPVYCPVKGFTVKTVDYAPQGGGNELWLISDNKLQIGDKLAYAWIPLCHAKKIFVKSGDKPSLGELIMIADNTGFSTGVHTHMGLYRVDINPNTNGIIELDQNNATNSYNPSAFFTSKYAIDQASLPTLIKSNWRYYQYKLGL